ncbi:MAG: hypothetical protein RIT35_773 [Pseudomonadota bacterium]|jgi:hypothetical protein
MENLKSNFYHKYAKSINFSLGLTLGVGLTMLTITMFHPSLLSKQYAYIDMKYVISSVNKVLDSQVLEKAQRDERIEVARAAFITEVDSYSKRHNVVIVSTCKSVAGTIDITDIIVPRIVAKVPR